MLLLSIVFISLVYTLACLSAGRLVFWLIPIKDVDDRPTSIHVELASEYLLGQGILASIWLLIAIQGRFSPSMIEPVVAILAFFGLGTVWKRTARLLNWFRSVWASTTRATPAWKLIALLTLISCLAWVTSLGRSPNGDGTSFYLPLAKVTADSHRLVPLPGFEELTSIGLQGEMHYAALISMGSPEAAQLFSWPVMLAGAVLLLAISQELKLGLRGKWLVLVMLLTSSAVVELSGSGKVDLFSMSLGIGGYYWALLIRREKGVATFWLAGLFCGLTCVAKISYLPTFIPSFGVIVAWSYFSRRQDSQERVSGLAHGLLPACMAIAGVCIAVAPHMIKNAVLFENPLAPWGAGGISLQDQTWYGPQTTSRILLSIPLALTFGDYWAQMGNISPLVLAFLPLFSALPRPRRLFESPTVIVTISAILGVGLWFIMRPSVLAPRYFLACLLLLILPAARAAELIFITGEKRMLGRVVTFATGFTLLLSGMYNLNRVFLPGPTLSHLFGRSAECEKAMEYCDIMTLINDSANLGDRLFTKTYLRYWLRPDLIQCAATTDELNAYRQLDTPEQRWSFIFGRGFEYIPIFHPVNPMEHLITKDLESIPNWLKITKIPVGDNLLLRLTSSDPSHRAQVGCGQVSPPAWDTFNL